MSKILKLNCENSMYNWRNYLEDIINSVEGVESLEDIQNPFFENDRTTTLNGERCYSITNDRGLEWIALNIDNHDDDLELLLKIWDFTISKYNVEIMEDEDNE